MRYILILLSASAVFAQVPAVAPSAGSPPAVTNVTVTGSLAAGGATHTAPTVVVATTGALPATCTTGELAFVTAATAGQAIYECDSANHWTQQAGGGGGSGTVTSVATTSPISGGTITGTGTLTCPTCVTSASALSTFGVVLGAGSQASKILANPGQDGLVLQNHIGSDPTWVSSVALGSTGLATGLISFLGSASGIGQITVAANAGGATFILPLADGTSGQPLLSGGTGSPVTWGGLTVPNGGTGLATVTSNAITKGNGASAMVVSGCLIDSSNNLSCPGTLTSGTGSGFAGTIDVTQGTAVGSFPANTASIYAPTSIATSYQWVMPAADAAGAIVSSGAGTPGVLSIVGFSGTGNIAKVSSPTIVTPTIASFTNATHNHTNAAGGGTLAESALALTNVTTNDVTTAAHGFAPVLPNDATKFLNGTGGYTVPAGSGGGGGWLGYSGAGLSFSGTQYFPVVGGGTPSATETDVDLPAPSASTIANLYAETSVVPGTGNSIAITFRKAGSDTTLTCTITAAITKCNDTTHSFITASNDLLSVKTVVTGTIVGTLNLMFGYSVGTSAVGVTSVSFTGGLVSVATATTTPALTVAGTSGGIPYFSAASTWASSGALTQYGFVFGGGAGGSPTSSAQCAANTLPHGNGASNPTCSAIVNGDITNSTIDLTTKVTGLLPLVNGGTNCATPYAINPQTSTYQAIAADFTCSKTITVASGTFTITLVASGSQPVAGSWIKILNYGSGVVTIARSGQNLNGGTTSLTVAAASATAPTSAQVWSDGTNYFSNITISAGGGASTVTDNQWYTFVGNLDTNAGRIHVGNTDGGSGTTGTVTAFASTTAYGVTGIAMAHGGPTLMFYPIRLHTAWTGSVNLYLEMFTTNSSTGDVAATVATACAAASEPLNEPRQHSRV